MRGISNITVTTTLQPGKKRVNKMAKQQGNSSMLNPPRTELLAPRSFLKNMKTWIGTAFTKDKRSKSRKIFTHKSFNNVSSYGNKEQV